MLLLAAGFALPAWAHSSEEAIDRINQELQDGIAGIEDAVAGYQSDLEDADSQNEASEMRLNAIDDVVDAEKDARWNIIDEAWGHHSNPAVQEAFQTALNTLAATSDDAIADIDDMYTAWIAANSTTTTTVTTVPPATTSTTSTTTPPSTTTTTKPTPATTTTQPTRTTTTTTTPAAALLPNLPDGPESSFTAAAPESAVMVSANVASLDMAEDQATAMVGLVTRVVESRLPAGVSDIAVGPLVVLGLILDAVRSAGLFMMIPWVLLIGYMAVLLLSNGDLLPNRRRKRTDAALAAQA